MKLLLPFFLFCFSFYTFSQGINRENVNGKIIVEGNDIEGITIYNTSANKGGSLIKMVSLQLRQP